jgi:predicted deacetylase
MRGNMNMDVAPEWKISTTTQNALPKEILFDICENQSTL